MAKDKAVKTKPVKKISLRKRGKKMPRRYAEKIFGSIINMRRRINCDDAGEPFPDKRVEVNHAVSS